MANGSRALMVSTGDIELMKGDQLQGKITSVIKQLKNYRLGMLAREVKDFVLSTPREINKLEKRFISLKPKKPCRGNVLLCYVNKTFFLKAGKPLPNDHTRNWEVLQIAKTFLDLGYQVDVIDENNDRFVPAKHYSFFVGNRINFDRIAASLNNNCVKVLHIDTAHWLFHNTAQYLRLLALQQRRGFTLPTRRWMKANLAIEHADYATSLGNEFTVSTYRYANKPIYRLPISTPALYPWDEDKDFEQSRKNFLWFGSVGFVHKGLDLVLEAFIDIPDCHLTICGPVQQERDFERAYREMLYETPNVHTVGWVDIDSPRFLEITRNCIGVVYPSCSESGGGSVISCMHAGLIPIVSRESSVDVDESFGMVLKECSIDEIKTSVRKISNLSTQELKRMARTAWHFARANHTRKRFAEEYRKIISAIMTPLADKGSAVETTSAASHFHQAATPISDDGDEVRSLY
jgi:glycosyltransferase involved in cell wall biosynthesis